MLIKMTEASTKLDFYMRASIIRLVQKSPQGITTLVVTNTVGPQGFLSYEVMDSPNDIASAVNIAEGLERQKSNGVGDTVSRVLRS